MSKTWLVATTTYRRRVRSGMFLILTFGLPILMVIAGAIPILREERGAGEVANIGYVDQTGRLTAVSRVSAEGATLNLTSYPSPDAARSAYQRGEITGYLVIPERYFQGEAATFFAAEEPNARIEASLRRFMQHAMLPNQPAWVLDRLSDPSEITYEAQNSGVTLEQGPAVVVRIALPAVLGLLFALAVFTGASQMGSVIVREKEQRSMEMIITSLAPRELVAGKVLGMTLLSLTQLGVWAIGGLIAIGLVFSTSLDIGTLSIPWNAVFWALLLGLPGYFLYAVTASGLGIIAGDQQQAQQLAGILGIVGLMPLWFLGIIIGTPDGAAAIALTLFPFTAPMLGLIRMAITDVPVWQLAASFVLIIATLAGSIWLVAHIFRAAMLLYGQALRPRQLIRALREA
jgi:ABC-2 type transport system permease protein